MGKTGAVSVWTTAIGIILTIVALSSAPFLNTVSAEKNPPVPGSGGMYETPGDWVIENGDDIFWDHKMVLLNGNLTVETGGRLSLDNIQLKFNCTESGEYGLTVMSGGYLRVVDSVINSMDPAKNYRMVLSGSVLFETVSVSGVYGDPEDPWEYGIELRSSNIQILNSTFYRCMGDALNVESSSPLIKGNYFYENMGAAIYTNGTSSPLISGNQVYRQSFGIISGYYSSPTIEKNSIHDIGNNGIILNGFMYPRVSNNTIHDCLNGMLLWYSNAILEDNVLYNNDAGYNIKVESRPTIKRDTVRDNLIVGISINDSIVDMSECNIFQNEYDGVRVFNGSRAKIQSSSIERNDDDGFQITDSYVEVQDSLIRNNHGDQFFMRDSSSVDLIRSTVTGSWGGPTEPKWLLNIGDNCKVSAYDPVFDSEGVAFGDASSRLSVSYTCIFLVSNEVSDPVSGATIKMYNETGYMRGVGTDEDGQGERYLPHYDQRDLNGDGDGSDPGEMSLHSYNYSVEAQGYLPCEGDIDIEGGDQINITLKQLPSVKVLRTLPENGDKDVDVTTTIRVWFDNEIDPSTFKMEITGPGGVPIFFDTSYRSSEFMMEAFTLKDLDHETTYTVEVQGVIGTNGGKLLSSVFFSFMTADHPESDFDDDKIPDSEDPDDDNDGYDDVVEEYHGTNPFDPLDYPVIEDGDDDDPGSDPGVDPDDDDTKPDDDEDIVIIPGTTVDDDDLPTDDDYEPVSTTDTLPDVPDGSMNYVILVTGTLLGLAILAGVVVLILIRSGGGKRLREEATGPPNGG
ncbi:MAG: right-handed parallel beta-helix repeat-containing protein [Thermoplasmatota archaeon]